MYTLLPNGISKPTVSELISYYKRQKKELRDDGTRLIRPIARPDYMVHNDDIHTFEVLGKVNLLFNHFSKKRNYWKCKTPEEYFSQFVNEILL
jgi:hypothetical protein